MLTYSEPSRSNARINVGDKQVHNALLSGCIDPRRDHDAVRGSQSYLAVRVDGHALKPRLHDCSSAHSSEGKTGHIVSRERSTILGSCRTITHLFAFIRLEANESYVNLCRYPAAAKNATLSQRRASILLDSYCLRRAANPQTGMPPSSLSDRPLSLFGRMELFAHSKRRRVG